MFKIEFFTDDKNLPHLLRAVTGKVMNLSVVPVVNAVPEKIKKGKGKGKLNGKLRQVHDAEQTIGLFCKELKKSGDNISSESAKEALARVGMSPTSYNHFLSRAVEAGLIKRAKKEGNKVTWAWV
jgi:hypothetical protein